MTDRLLGGSVPLPSRGVRRKGENGRGRNSEGQKSSFLKMNLAPMVVGSFGKGGTRAKV